MYYIFSLGSFGFEKLHNSVYSHSHSFVLHKYCFKNSHKRPLLLFLTRPRPLLRPKIWHILLFSVSNYCKRPLSYQSYSNVTNVQFLTSLTQSKKYTLIIVQSVLSSKDKFTDNRCLQTKVSDILFDLRLKTQKHSSILDFVEKLSNATEWL